VAARRPALGFESWPVRRRSDIDQSLPKMNAYAKVGQQGVDCPGLDTMLAAQIAKLSGGNMIVPVGIEERKRHEARDDLLPGFGF